ncbi:MAG: MATE family efflux transporter [Spirochaetales bacterium]|nr:MATE family efflux transporter [Candidatus Physcosoma equi]
MRKDTKDMLKLLSAIAIPIMLQNLVQSSLGFLDTLMIGQLGQAEIAAVGTANQVYFLVQVFLFGVNSASSIFFAQYYGAKQNDKMRRVTAFALTIALVGAVLGGLAALLIPREIMIVFSTDQEVIRHGILYLRTVAISFSFVAVSLVLSGGFRAEGDTKTPLRITIISLTTNAILNYLLIFGPGPLPVLGVRGGAIATVIARFLEMTLLTTLTIRRKTTFAIKGKDDFHWSNDFLKGFLFTAIPAILNDALWAIGSTLYKVAFSKLGTSALAVTNITESIGNLFFIAAIGIANGSTVILGNTLGSGDKRKAVEWGTKMTYTAFLIGIAMGLLEAATAPLFSLFFHMEGNTADLMVKTLLALAVIQPIESTATVLIIGILRSGGDTKFSLYAESGCQYFIGLPMVFLGVYVFHLSLPALYLLKLTEMCSKFLLAYIHMRGGKWAKVMTGKEAS